MVCARHGRGHRFDPRRAHHFPGEIKPLQSELGHTNSRMTLDVYTQPIPGAQKELAGKIARLLLSVAPKLVQANQSKGGLPN